MCQKGQKGKWWILRAQVLREALNISLVSGRYVKGDFKIS